MGIERRLKQELSSWPGGRRAQSPSYEPGTLAKTARWTIDSAQIVPAIVGPVAGVFALAPGLGPSLVLLYWAALGAAVAAFCTVAFAVPIGTYGSWRWWPVPLLSPVVVGLLAVNLACAGAAAVIGTQASQNSTPVQKTQQREPVVPRGNQPPETPKWEAYPRLFVFHR